MQQIITDIRRTLLDNADEKTLSLSSHFFKENERAKTYGVRMALVSKIGKEFFQKIKNMPKVQIFSLCEELWQSGYLEAIVN